MSSPETSEPSELPQPSKQIGSSEGKRPPRRRWRRVLRWSAGGLALLGVLVALFGPSVASSIAAGVIVEAIEKQVGGSASLEELSISWGGEVELLGLEVRGTGGELLLSCPRAHASVAVWQALGGTYQVDAVVEEPIIVVTRGAAGQPTLALWRPAPEPAQPAPDAAESKGQGDSQAGSASGPLPDVRGSFRLEGARFVYRNPEGDSDQPIGTLTARMDITQLSRPIAFQVTLTEASAAGEPGQVEVSGTMQALRDGRLDLDAAKGELRYRVSGLSLDQPVLRELLELEVLRGSLWGEGSYVLRPGRRVEGSGALTVSGFHAAGPALEGQPVAFQKLTLQNEVRFDPERPGTQHVEIRADEFFSLTIDGSTQGLPGPDGSAELTFHLSAQLPGLTRALGGALRLREGVALEGSLELTSNVTLRFAGGQLAGSDVSVTGSIDGLGGRDADGHALELGEKVSLDLVGSFTPGRAATLTRLDVRAASLEVKGSGAVNLERGTVDRSSVTVDVDLDDLTRKLEGIFALDFTVGGDLHIDVQMQGSDDENTVARVTGVAKLDALRYRAKRVGAVGDGDGNDDADGSVLLDGELQLSMELSRDRGGSGSRWQWQGTLGAAAFDATVGADTWRVRDVTLAFDAHVDLEQGEAGFTSERLGVAQLVLARAAQAPVRIEAIAASGSGTVRWGQDRLQLDATVKGEGLSLELNGRWPGEPGEDGEAGAASKLHVHAESDLARAAARFGALVGIGADDVAGNGVLDATLLQRGLDPGDGDPWKVEFTVDDLRVRVPAPATGPDVELSEARLAWSGEGTIASDAIVVTRSELTSETISGTCQGRIEIAEETRVLKGFSGRFRYLPDRLGKLLAPWLPGELRGSEMRELAFELTGSVGEQDIFELLAGLVGKVDLGLGEFEMSGIRSSGELHVELRDGSVITASTLAVNDGQLVIDGTLDLRPQVEARSQPRSQLRIQADEVGANSRLGWLLGLIHPIFAVAESAVEGALDGKVTCDVTVSHSGPITAELIQGGWKQFPKQRLNGKGHFEIHDFTVSGTPLLGELLRVLGTDRREGIELNPVDFTIRDGRLSYDRPMQMKIGGYDTFWTGSVGLDETLDLVWELPITERLARKERVLKPLVGQTVQVPVRGTSSRPRIDWGGVLADAAKKGIGGLVQKELDDLLGRGSNKGESAADLLARADRLWDQGKRQEAAQLYDEIRRKHRRTLVYQLNKRRIKKRRKGL